MSFTILSPNKERLGVKEQLPETLQTLMDEHIKAMEKTWTIEFPFLREEPMLSQIYESYLLLPTEVSAEILMEVLKVKPVKGSEKSEFSEE